MNRSRIVAFAFCALATLSVAYVYSKPIPVFADTTCGYNGYTCYPYQCTADNASVCGTDGNWWTQGEFGYPTCPDGDPCPPK
jgi:hypothetical protein